MSRSTQHRYELISDITRMGDWSPECYRCEWLNGATTAVEGARFRGHNRLGKVRWHTDAIVTVADPGREFGFTTLHKEGREETMWRYELSLDPWMGDFEWSSARLGAVSRAVDVAAHV